MERQKGCSSAVICSLSLPIFSILKHLPSCLELSSCGLKVEVLDEEAMRAEGMHLLLSVGDGSERASRMVVMRWMVARRMKHRLHWSVKVSL